MTTNMRNPAEQAAYEFGRAAAKYEMAIGAATSLTFQSANALRGGDTVTAKGSAGGTMTYVVGAGAEPRKRRGRVAKVTPRLGTAEYAPKEPKAHKIARGVKRASTGPRTKGVKEAIVNMIADHPQGVTVDGIVDRLGFKETSVRATLMGLKKKGLVSQDGKLWADRRADQYSPPGNSETAQHSDVY